jgi:DNA-binding MarR family transcriptional regulator
MLTQLGTDAAMAFARALDEHGLSPPLAGIMRLLHAQPGLNQQQVADVLGTAPSRVVGYLDELAERGWITRTRDDADRRVNVLQLTPAGAKAWDMIAKVAQRHETTFTEALTDAEHSTLKELLSKLVAARGLTPGVHPGYRTH